MAREPEDPAATQAVQGLVSGDAPTQAVGGAAPARRAADDPRYTVMRVLGRGGMGEVSLCRDTWLGRDIARKRATGGSSDRFLREVRLQARLDHPAIVPLFEASPPDGPEPFFTMRHVSGDSLRTVLDRLRAGDPNAAATWNRRRLLTEFVRVAEAIAFAHDRGIIHRDIKPDNIMLGEYGAVYVLDWGIAKTDDELAVDGVSPMPGTDDALTREGTSMGTLGYMAPEQLEDARAVDGRADVYALGAVLFEILTLQRLHGGSVPALAASTLEGADARASVRAPEADVPPELEAICVRATAMLADDRYPDVRSLLAELERFLDGDRDLERRRALAIEHLAAAARLIGDGSDHDARSAAMREAMRALAFDPENPDARSFLARLLIEPPKVIPAELEATLTRDAGIQAQQHAKVGFRSGLGWFAFLTTMLVMGVRSWPMVAALLVAIVFVVFRGAHHARSPEHATRGVYITVAAICTMLAITTRWFGPFVMVPGVVAGVLGTFALHPRVRRVPLIVLGLGSFTVPWLAELAGLLPRSYEFTGDTWITHAALTDLAPGVSQAVLWVGSAAGVIIQALSMTTIRDNLAAAQRQLALHAWQLDQLVPRR